MTLPDQHLFSTAEVATHLSVSQSTVRRLIDSGELTKVYPAKRTMRITRESLVKLLEKSATPGAVAASMEQGNQARAQAAKVAEQQRQEEKKKSLAYRWGLGNIFGKSTR